MRYDAKELVDKRTERSRTFTTPQGLNVSQFFEQPVNFKDSEGAWQPIDTTLTMHGKGARNTAGRVRVSLPGDLATGPVRLEAQGRSVAFTLKGAGTGPPVGQGSAPSPHSDADEPAAGGDGAVVPEPEAPQEFDPGSAPQPPANPQEPAPGSAATPDAEEPSSRIAPSSSAPVLKGETASYRNVFAGVDAKYTVLAEGVKEELILAGPDAPTSYDFTVQLSPGLTPHPNELGGIDLLDGTGGVWAQFAPPFAYDASFPGTTPMQGVTTTEVALEIVPGTPQLTIRLSITEAWLSDARKFPVVLDHLGRQVHRVVLEAGGAPLIGEGQKIAHPVVGGGEGHPGHLLGQLAVQPVIGEGGDLDGAARCGDVLGAAKALYVDNGSPFVSRQLIRACAVLGIRWCTQQWVSPRAGARSNASSARYETSSWWSYR